MKKRRKINRIISYYKKYGLKYVVKICIEKALKLEEKRYNKLYRGTLLSEEEVQRQRKEYFEYMPKFSIVVPLYRTPETYLRYMVESVCQQTYQNWELCLSDGSGINSPIKKFLDEFVRQDKRIKVIDNLCQLHISENTNKALTLCTGDYVVFMDHDDLLARDALYQCAKVLNINPGIKMIYTDEDKVSMDGKKHFQPCYKPDFNRDLLNSTNYFGHLVVVDRGIVEQVGDFNSEFDGAQDYDFVLRCTEITESIYHIPRILYHWRMHKESTADNPESKMYAFEAGANAVRAHYERIGLKNTKVRQTKCLGVYRTRYVLQEKPKVTIIIPNRDHVDDLKKCLFSIECCRYSNYEILIVENNSREKETFAFYDKIEEKNKSVRILYWDGEFNYSAINNYGVKYASGDYILFLNNDTVMINRECIEELVGFCIRNDVGAVGARLFFDDDSIQHAGVVVGLGGIAGHIFLNTPKDQVGYFARIITQQNYSAVTGACIMVKKKVFEEIGGFDTHFKVAYNDVDLCLRIREKGYLIVYNPYAELYHYESKTRGREDTSDKIERLNKESMIFIKRWEKLLEKGDPYYNRNLSTERMDCKFK
ncbi:glycosyltransferase family 2 protein [Sporofaciens musculi]|jgi:GT2 family glycosyltransferase|uniref:glycosyltransferase family 2 protein n=1 Tax=Sporofaciens musculi TaxID=2681861 RepID=UPI0025A1C7FB|nr:glycosyltransferase family 2 protein [Sporofaciens musculi]